MMLHQKLLDSVADIDRLIFTLSTNYTDRYSDVIDQSGWDLKHFRANPVCLFNHIPSFMVGTWPDVRVENGKLVGRLQLAPAGTSERIDEIRALVKAGILTATSVGFRPIASEPRPGGGMKYLRQELVEASLVPIPANPQALLQAKSLGISSRTIDTIFEGRADAASLEARKARAKRAIAEARRVIAMVDARQRAERSQVRSSSLSTDKRVRVALQKVDQDVALAMARLERTRRIDEEARLRLNYDPDQRQARFANLEPALPTKPKRKRPRWPAPE